MTGQPIKCEQRNIEGGRERIGALSVPDGIIEAAGHAPHIGEAALRSGEAALAAIQSDASFVRSIPHGICDTAQHLTASVPRRRDVWCICDKH